MFFDHFKCKKEEGMYKIWDPLKPGSITSMAGNYIFILRQGVELFQPKMDEKPIYKTIVYEGREYNVLYTGVGKNLYERIIKVHYGDNAGRSTLRKSLGSLCGYGFIPRDKNKPMNGKTKFKPEDEQKITSWMMTNLIVLYKENPNYAKDEIKLINKYNPPLNIKENENSVNWNYREKLHLLRKG